MKNLFESLKELSEPGYEFFLKSLIAKFDYHGIYNSLELDVKISISQNLIPGSDPGFQFLENLIPSSDSWLISFSNSNVKASDSESIPFLQKLVTYILI